MPGSKTTKKMINRKGPAQSAKLFDIGTKKRGADTRTWEIVSYNGVKRWVAITPRKTTTKRSSNSRTNTRQSSRSGNNKTTTKRLNPNRKAPSSSATIYDVGTKKRGNDGRQWIVSQSSAGVKRWIPLAADVDAVKYRNDSVTFFDLDKILPKMKLGRIKNIGYLDITSNTIGIGELLFSRYPAKKGKWNLYHYDGSLIAVHDSQKLAGQKFQIVKGSVFCDIGSFSFNDAKRVTPYMERKTKSGIYGESFPYFDTGILLPDPIRTKSGKISRKITQSKEYTYVYETDLDINKNNMRADDRDPIAVFAENNYGDGQFPIYKGRNAYWIMSNNIHNKIMSLVTK